MKSQSQLKRIEYLVYGILFLLILIGPTLSTLFHGHDINDVEFLKDDFLHSFKAIIVYVIAFAIHDIFIAPLLVNKHKPWLYFLGVVVLGAAFMFYQHTFRPKDYGPRHKLEKVIPANKDTQAPPVEAKMPPPDNNIEYASQKPADEATPPMAPPPFRRLDIVTMIFFLFGIGTNIGVKFYFRSLIARREIEVLEKENLKQSLDQLRYQLHPHFFMNTLNNIHALVDIDPKKAQECIIDLSKLMRYVLYESNHEFVQASKESEFMKNYVRLTRIRYSDKLKFNVSNSDDGAKVWIPPLIFISFVENAFKHGVSYNKESFIDIVCKIYDDDDGNPRMYWTCHNSKHNGNSKKKVDEASGIGLSNVRQRLDLIFGKNYTLNITDGKNDFLVEMDIPVYTSDPTVNA